MLITGHDGKVVNAKLEVVEQRIESFIIMSTIREPTEDEVAVLQSKKCDHDHQDMILVVDEPGFLYDSRSCALCGKGLGTV